MSPSSVEVTGSDEMGLDPMRYAEDMVIGPVAEELGVPRPAGVKLITRVGAAMCYEVYPGVYKYASKKHLRRFVRAQLRHARLNKQSVTVAGWDISNLSAFNGVYGEDVADKMLVHPFLDILVSTLKELLVGRPHARVDIFHYGGGDEYLALIYGVDELACEGVLSKTPCRTVTSQLDEVVRRTAKYSKEKGFSYVPHSKRVLRIAHWGSRLIHAARTYDPRIPGAKMPRVAAMLENIYATLNVYKKKMRYKRGLRPGDKDPLKLGYWEEWKRMFCMPLAIITAITGRNLLKWLQPKPPKDVLNGPKVARTDDLDDDEEDDDEDCGVGME